MTSNRKLEPVADQDELAASARRIYDLREHISELEVTVAERLERERVLTLELAAARRDLEVKAAYNVMLESAALERRQSIEWLQGRVEQLSHELAHAVAENAGHTQQAAAATARVGELTAELAAERARLSYRLAQRVVARVGYHPRLTGTARRLYRATRHHGAPPAR